MIDYDSLSEVVGMEGRHLSRLSAAGNIMLLSAWLKAEAASVAVREARTYTNGPDAGAATAWHQIGALAAEIEAKVMPGSSKADQPTQRPPARSGSRLRCYSHQQNRQ